MPRVSRPIDESLPGQTNKLLSACHNQQKSACDKLLKMKADQSDKQARANSSKAGYGANIKASAFGGGTWVVRRVIERLLVMHQNSQLSVRAALSLFKALQHGTEGNGADTSRSVRSRGMQGSGDHANVTNRPSSSEGERNSSQEAARGCVAGVPAQRKVKGVGAG